jgi:hypothetical protein
MRRRAAGVLGESEFRFEEPEGELKSRKISWRYF